jgi:hypothetical protein
MALFYHAKEKVLLGRKSKLRSSKRPSQHLYVIISCQYDPRSMLYLEKVVVPYEEFLNRRGFENNETKINKNSFVSLKKIGVKYKKQKPYLNLYDINDLNHIVKICV